MGRGLASFFKETSKESAPVNIEDIDGCVRPAEGFSPPIAPGRHLSRGSPVDTNAADAGGPLATGRSRCDNYQVERELAKRGRTGPRTDPDPPPRTGRLASRAAPFCARRALWRSNVAKARGRQGRRKSGPDPSALTADQAAKLLGVPVATIRQHLADGAPADATGRINLLHYVAWLVSRNART